SDRTWARLADGTPLVTAEQRGKGWIVLFHITAGPSWSSLPLSGLYVDMLRRLLMLANGTRPGEMTSAATLPALLTLDGFAHLRSPGGDVLPLRASQLAKTTPSRAHPPGLYGTQGAGFALNLVRAHATLLPISGMGAEPYAEGGETALEPPLLTIAMLLLLIDALISLSLRGLIPVLRFAGLVAAIAVLHIGGVRADEPSNLKAA